MTEPGYMIVWADHYKVTQPNLYKYYLNQQFVDVTLVCDGAKMKAHAVILAAGCKYFEKALSSQLSTIQVSGITPEVLSTIIHFLYLGKAAVEAKNIDAVLAAAKHLGVIGLNQFSKENIVNSDNHEINDEQDVLVLLEALENSAMGNMIKTELEANDSKQNEDATAAEFLLNELDNFKPVDIQPLYAGKNDDVAMVVLDKDQNQYFTEEDDGYLIHELRNVSAIPKSLDSDESTLVASDLEYPESGEETGPVIAEL